MKTSKLLLIMTAVLATACGKKSSDSSSNARPQQQTTDTTLPTVAQAGTLAIDLEGAIGLAVTAPLTGADAPSGGATSPGSAQAGSVAALLDDASNLQKVNADGTLSPAFKGENPKVAVQHVLVKGEHIFILFASQINLIPGGVDQTAFDPTRGHVCWDGSSFPHDGQSHTCPDKPQCMLAYAKLSDGILSCVDSDVTYMPWTSGVSPIIQTDDAGNVFYTAYTGIAKTAIFRKLDTSGKKTDVVVDGVSNFLLRPNGDVFYNDHDKNALGAIIGGQTKHISALSAGFMAAFPDGNVYVDQTTDYSLGETLVKVEDGVLSPTPYLAPASNTDAKFATSGKCTGGYNMLTTADKKLFALSQGNDDCPAAIIQFYPTYEVKPFKNLKVWQGGSGDLMKFGANDSKMVVGGTDNTGTNKLIAVDPETGVESDLLPKDEVKLSAVAVKGNTVTFSGKKLSNAALVDNDGLMLLDDTVPAGTEIIGSVDLTNGQVSVAPSTVSLSEIQSL